MLTPLNLIEIETRWGYRTFELYHGSLTDIGLKVDVLAFSSFAENYEPLPGTVIAALRTGCEIDVGALALHPEYDLRAVFDCWVARVAPNDRFERIICVELIGGRRGFNEAIQNLFVALSALEMKGVEVRTLALPVLGAGQMGLEPATIIKELLDNALRYLYHSPNLRQVLFVEINEERARALDAAMNQELGRVKVVLPKGELVDGIRNEILRNVDKAELLADEGARALFSDVRRFITPERSRSFEIGIVSRRVVEFIVNDITKRQNSADLMRKIDDLGKFDVADWIRSYMHVLRIFGNESAHERDKSNRRPRSIAERDVAICLFCLQRLLDFWIGLKQAGGDGS
jgi:O-acetyl-ADP-ribose deacetylase (regulator of RNase III)